MRTTFFMSKGRIYLVLYYGGLFKFKKKLYTNVYANASKDFKASSNFSQQDCNLRNKGRGESSNMFDVFCNASCNLGLTSNWKFQHVLHTQSFFFLEILYVVLKKCRQTIDFITSPLPHTLNPERRVEESRKISIV